MEIWNIELKRQISAEALTYDRHYKGNIEKWVTNS